MKYLLSYYHNGHGEGHGWTYGCAVSQHRFESEMDAYKYISDNPQYTPRKLLKKSEYEGLWDTVKDFSSDP